MRRFAALTFFASLLASSLAASEPDLKPCTARSPSKLFYDLNQMAAILPDHDGALQPGERNTSWIARGYDYNANFTINFCAPVVEELDNVVGVDRALWPNISAFYTQDSRTYSLGQLSTEPVFRGRKFVLNYTDGSPCSDTVPSATSTSISQTYPDFEYRAVATSSATLRRKNTIISLLCDRDTADANRRKVGVSFVASSPDECSYFFEARSQYLCGSAVSEPQNVGPGSVFGIIILIALAVYILGGVAYQRIVMHQRGWRQLPNYAIWAGIGNFFFVSWCRHCISTFANDSGFHLALLLVLQPHHTAQARLQSNT